MLTLPTFNLAYDWWVPGNPTSNPPDVTGQCQLYLYNRAFVLADHTISAKEIQLPQIRVDVNFWNNVATPIVTSIFKVLDQFGNPWYYRVVWWDYIHRGFANEYIQIDCVQCDSNGVAPDAGR